MNWINWSTANHPDSWDTGDFGVIEFASAEDAKHAETLFNAIQAELAALKGKHEQVKFNYAKVTEYAKQHGLKLEFPL